MTEEVESAGARALACRMDLLDRASCVEAIERTLATFGRIDVLVNSGIDYGDGMGVFAETPIETYERACAANVIAPLFLIQGIGISSCVLRTTDTRHSDK